VNSSAHQPPQIARANGIDLCYEIFGDAAAEPLLLIMGLGAQMIHWDDDFCRQLAARGFRVIRFDNRDIGKSSKLTGGKRLTPVELLKLRFLKIPVAAPYTLLDMAKDTTGLMDVLGTSISIGLQYGVPLEIFVNKFAHSRFEPAGFTKNPELPIAKSLMDYVFRWLASRFLDQEDQDAVGVIRRQPPTIEMPEPEASAPPAAAGSELKVVANANGNGNGTGNGTRVAPPYVAPYVPPTVTSIDWGLLNCSGWAPPNYPKPLT